MKRLLVLAAIAAMVLAACSPGTAASPSPTPSASPSPSATPSVTPSPSPSPSATATAADACPTWTDDPDAGLAQIGPARFMGACIGHTFDEAAANGTTVTPVEQCPWVGDIVSIDDPGLYVIAVRDPSTADEPIMYFVLRWFADPGLAASYEVPRTAEDITIGSSRADVLAAYPDATEVTFDDLARGPRTQLVVSTDAGTTYNFDIDGGVVTEISWGDKLAQGGPNGDICAL